MQWDLDGNIVGFDESNAGFMRFNGSHILDCWVYGRYIELVHWGLQPDL